MMQQQDFLAVLRHSAATRQQISRRLMVRHRRARYWAIARRGFILIAAYLGVAMMSTMSLAYFSRISADHTAAKLGGDQTRSIHYAEAGLDQALVELADDPDYTGTISITDVGVGAYDVTVTPHTALTDAVVIDATGHYPSPNQATTSSTEQLRLVTSVVKNAFSWVLFGDEGVNIPGTVTLDAYDSDDGPPGTPISNQNLDFDVGTNATGEDSVVTGPNFNAPTATLVCGAATPDLDACIDGDGRYAGEAMLEDDLYLWTPTLPPEINYAPASVSMTTGTLSLAATTPTVKLVGTGDDAYYAVAYRNFAIGGSARVEMNKATFGGRPLRIYVTGTSMSFAGNSSFGDVTTYKATDLQIFVTSAAAITFSGTPNVVAGIYAPLADITSGSGTLNLWGAMVVNSLNFAGTMNCWADLALRPTSGRAVDVMPLVHINPKVE